MRQTYALLFALFVTAAATSGGSGGGRPDLDQRTTSLIADAPVLVAERARQRALLARQPEELAEEVDDVVHLAILEHRFESWSSDWLLRLASRATPPQ